MQGDHRSHLVNNMGPGGQYQPGILAMGVGDFGQHSATALLLGQQQNILEDQFYHQFIPQQMPYQFNQHQQQQQYMDMAHHHQLMNLQDHQQGGGMMIPPHPRIQEEDPEVVRSGSEDRDAQGSGDDQDQGNEDGPARKKRKKYHRHTQLQIQEMEAFFKENPHPDEKQRRELAARLVLDVLQVKFWFQNKRTQIKTQKEREENTNLRTQNEALMRENEMLREAFSIARCSKCLSPSAAGELSFDGHELIMENSRLRNQINELRAAAARYGVPQEQVAALPNMAPPQFQIPNQRAGGMMDFRRPLPPNMFAADMIRAADACAGNMMGIDERAVPEVDKKLVHTLASSGMDEVGLLTSVVGDTLWVAGTVGEKLNEEEYRNIVPRKIGDKPEGWKTEATRDTTVVMMCPPTVVGILMDANKWSTMFAGIVSNAATVEVLSNGMMTENYNGTLQLMSVDFQLPSPLVSTRACFFVRYSKRQDNGSWLVVDVSLNDHVPGQTRKSLRMPSGCLIQDVANGCSKVTWVEHSEVDDSSVHEIYKKLVNSGLAFGATRWVATLNRQSARLSSVQASDVPPMDGPAAFPPEGKRGVLKLAQRLVMGFYSSVRSSGITQQWTGHGDGPLDIKFITNRNVNDPMDPSNSVVSAATSMWLPVPPKRVFDFLRDENSRGQWDILSASGVVQKMANFVHDRREEGNCVTLLQVNGPQSNKENMILQETFTDATGSYVVYSPLDVASLQRALEGKNTDSITLVGSGFGILPDGGLAQAVGEDGSVVLEGGRSGGTLLTMVFQIVGNPSQFPRDKFVSTVNELIARTVNNIKGAASVPEGDDQ